MRIKLQKNPQSSVFLIEIPATVNVKQLSVGEKFNVFIIDKNNKKNLVEACFIADKKSLLLQENVVRLAQFNRPHCFQAHIIRPVEPKESVKNKALGDLKSPMTGKVISIAVKNEDVVKTGDVLLVIEAMKMENRILAEGEGVVKNLKVKSGQSVTSGDVLLTLSALK